MMVLQVKEIHKQYPQFLLDKISFELPEGAIMGLIGENGAGKSTTMRIILGMAQADSGSVSIFGHEGVTEQDRAQIGVVFDELPFNQTLFVSHQGRVILSKNKDELIYGYGIARADRQTLAAVDSSLVEAIQDGPYGSQALINDRVRFEREYPDILLDRLNLDEMMVMLCRNEVHRQ